VSVRLEEATGAQSTRDSELGPLLRIALARRASDLILAANAAPMAHVQGAWEALASDALDAKAVERLLRPILSEDQLDRLERDRDLDFALRDTELGRFRGKSSTLAAMVDHINHTRVAHIITIEDPVEFAFTNALSIIEQREVGDDTPSFASALRHILRQRPDVILIGELRDLETVSTALTAAETGHLVLATLHTADASQTIDRIIDLFPPGQQPQARTQMAATLRAILCQALVFDQLNDRLTPATEILVATSGVRRALRENEPHLIYSMIETGRCHGMHTMEQSLAALVQEGRVERSQALAVAPDPLRLDRLLGGRGRRDELAAHPEWAR
jgi:Tfp pilus assembly pilus retraction ATPase PilT